MIFMAFFSVKIWLFSRKKKEKKKGKIKVLLPMNRIKLSIPSRHPINLCCCLHQMFLKCKLTMLKLSQTKIIFREIVHKAIIPITPNSIVTTITIVEEIVVAIVVDITTTTITILHALFFVKFVRILVILLSIVLIV